MPPQELGEFLTWLGSNAAIGMVISWIMSNWGWFQERSSGEKTAILYAVAVAMGIVSKLAITYVPAGVITDLQPYYTILLNSIIIVGGQQIWYTKVEKPRLKAQGKAQVAVKSTRVLPPLEADTAARA